MKFGICTGIIKERIPLAKMCIEVGFDFIEANAGRLFTMTDEEIEAMFNKRESVPLTMENARFFLSSGGLVSLELKNENGETETFERVVIIRSFPVSNPDEYISIREPNTKRRGNGAEIGMIKNLADFDKATVELLNTELDRRYFTPR